MKEFSIDYNCNIAPHPLSLSFLFLSLQLVSLVLLSRIKRLQDEVLLMTNIYEWEREKNERREKSIKEKRVEIEQLIVRSLLINDIICMSVIKQRVSISKRKSSRLILFESFLSKRDKTAKK